MFCKKGVPINFTKFTKKQLYPSLFKAIFKNNCFVEQPWAAAFYVRSRSTSVFPASMYSCKVKNGNSRSMCEIFSKLTIKTPEQCQCTISFWSLLLTFNRIHTLFWSFYYWLWTRKFPSRHIGYVCYSSKETEIW